MTRSLYIVGGAGVGKSTFMRELLEHIYVEGPIGPLIDIDSKPNARGTKITLRGHELPGGGVYLGHMRDLFPGTDGLDRASSIVAEQWLESGRLPAYIVAEGATLATSRALTALQENTDLLLVHLHCEEFVRELRCLERGSNQDSGFLKATTTRSLNLFNRFGGLDVDTADPTAWKLAIAGCLAHLRGTE